MRFNAAIFPVIHRANFEVMLIGPKTIFNLPQFSIFRNDFHRRQRVAAISDDGVQTVELGVLRDRVGIEFGTARAIELQKLRFMFRYESFTRSLVTDLLAQFCQQFCPLLRIVLRTLGCVLNSVYGLDNVIVIHGDWSSPIYGL